MIAFLVPFLGAFFSQALAFVLKFMTKKTLAVVGYSAALLLCVNLLISFFLSLLLVIKIYTPSFISSAASLVVPDNAPLCVAVVVSARIALYAYAAVMKKITAVYMGPSI